jgi:hypothetical protein
MALVFSRFFGESGSSPGSNGCVLNPAPFSDQPDRRLIGQVRMLDRLQPAHTARRMPATVYTWWRHACPSHSRPELPLGSRPLHTAGCRPGVVMLPAVDEGSMDTDALVELGLHLSTRSSRPPVRAFAKRRPSARWRDQKGEPTMSSHELTRRDLITAAGAAAVGLSTVTLAGCASTAPADAPGGSNGLARRSDSPTASTGARPPRRTRSRGPGTRTVRARRSGTRTRTRRARSATAPPATSPTITTTVTRKTSR